MKMGYDIAKVFTPALSKNAYSKIVQCVPQKILESSLEGNDPEWNNFPATIKYSLALVKSITQSDSTWINIKINFVVA